ncbi:serine protease inhibitor 3/4 isoform X2 [Cephus cinctus]|uniref:Serine protease inhibitor 3/4 isoform X2 n=1 Tax=Cephus cinctus TaxID=211228 RepID=A0AAJ7W741_CEPCN|nr:serine protease inhibitor 3/4 isoform X2 [Cephus cinctus]
MGPFFICLTVLCTFLVTYTNAEKIVTSNSPLSVIASASNSFGIDFLKRLLQEKTGNIICSPLSVNIVLAMAAYGARGNTGFQIRQTLTLPEEDAIGQSGYESLITSLNDIKTVDLQIANKIFVAKKFEVNPDYTAITKDIFHSECETVDVSNPTAAAATINSWCANNTNNRIKDLLTPDDIDNRTKLVLINAIYFKGKWKDSFDGKYTSDLPFHINSNTIKEVPMMTITSMYLHGQLHNLDARFVELPYKGDEVSMFIIVPNKIDGLQRIENNIHDLDFSRLNQYGRNEEVILFVPKFKIENTIELNNLLQKVGMAEMFTDAADFSGIADTPLKVSKILQKGFIEVNEEGSEAVAASAFLVRPASADAVYKPVIQVDRPFLYAIVDSRYKSILFYGRIQDPTL